MNIRFMLSLALVAIYGNLIGQDVGARTLKSQSRTTIANIGKCDITIKYHSPSVNGRKIFGGIVPYDFIVEGKEYPWRAGANQRTTIEFSRDVKVEGVALSGGSYGFLVLVDEDEWALIFSSGKSWGAFNYDKSNDVLRVPVKPQNSSYQEWLSYEFVEPQNESVTIRLAWEETMVNFNVSTNSLDNIISDLEKIEDKTAEDYQQLAKRTLEKDPEAKELALEYLEKSLKKVTDYQEEVYQKAYTFNYKVMKGELLKKMGDQKAGGALIKEALNQASGFNVYYYALNMLFVEGRQKEALEILVEQTERDPENRANYFALGEYYLKAGEQAKATESFKKAYELAKGTPGENYARYLYHQNRLVLAGSK